MLIPNSQCIHAAAKGTNVFFLWLSSIPLYIYICPISFFSILLSVDISVVFISCLTLCFKSKLNFTKVFQDLQESPRKQR